MPIESFVNKRLLSDLNLCQNQSMNAFWITLFALLALSACQTESPAAPMRPDASNTPPSSTNPLATSSPLPAASLSPPAPQATAGVKASASPIIPTPEPSATISAQPDPRVNEPQIDARFVAQLFYQTDCLSGQINCSHSAYAAQWQNAGITSNDSRLSQWQTLRNRYDLSRPTPTTLTDLAEPLVFQSSNLWNQVRGIAFSSDNLGQFEHELKDLLGTEDQVALLAILDSFSKQFFEAWWQNTGQAQAQQLVLNYQETFTQNQIGPLIESINRFYQGQPNPLAQIQFHLILQAPGAENLSLAEQILNHGVIEVSPSQSPHSQLDVMIHEMTHYLFKQMPASRQAEIQRFFAQQPEPAAMSAYHLLDETLATAFGNGIVNQKVLRPEFFADLLTRPNSFFNDAFIDINAKALFESGLLENDQFRLSDPAFLNAYYQGTLGTFNLNHPIPALRLSTIFLSTPDLKAAVPEFQARLKPWVQFVIAAGNSGPGFFQRHPRLNGVLWFEGDLNTGLGPWRELIGESAYQDILGQKSPAFIYGISTPERQFYLLHSNQSSQRSALMALLFAQPKNFSGILLP